MIKELDIRCTGPQQLTRQLSGGNQQKVCIARALTLDPNVLFVSEPTRGIDIGAKKLVLDLLVKLNKELGMTIIMTSSELIELRSICDRIAIISGGKVEGILRPGDSDRDFGLMMAGEYKKMKEKEAM
jgi:simple sugar transport system ATP-binding protein